jgi:hypothetical protein
MALEQSSNMFIIHSSCVPVSIIFCSPHDFLYYTRTALAPCVRPLSETPTSQLRVIANRFADPRSSPPACWSPNPPLLLVIHPPTPGGRRSTSCGVPIQVTGQTLEPIVLYQYLKPEIINRPPDPLTTEVLSVYNKFITHP